VPRLNKLPSALCLLSPMPEANPRIAVYPGSFDPITLGHLDVIKRASRLFDRLIVGVGTNMEKAPLFDAGERQALIHATTSNLKNIEIRTFRGLAVEFVQECGGLVMIRGVRPITDIAAELTMMMANRRIARDIETLFMIADGELAHVSSSLIKQIAHLASDEVLSRFLPPVVVRALRAKMSAAGGSP
jgi:pantetheine-phosphate adenylyltransferase